jgi:hypothetical protein
MTLADRGRFCGECKKVVRELAQLTEKQARALLASPPTEGLCVRYVHDTTGEILFRPAVVPVGRLARAKRAAVVALAAASLPLAAAGCMGSAPVPPPVMGSPVPTQTPPVETMDDVTMGAVAPYTLAPPPQPAQSAVPVATDGGVPPR